MAVNVRPVAGLPMYNLPENQAALQNLWVAFRDALLANGISAPRDLSTGLARMELWRAPGLVLAQTCGLPYGKLLMGHVSAIGTPDYSLEGCPPGYYRSVLVVRRDEPREDLQAFSGSPVAVNDPISQSGHAALLREVAPLVANAAFRLVVKFTGSYAGSLQAVISGQADLAAVDAVSWRLYTRFQDVSRHLRVIGQTSPTPGLPLVTALTDRVPVIRQAIREALQQLDAETRDVFGIAGLVEIDDSKYSDLADVFARDETICRSG